jgi:hypothetical protein
MKLPWIILAASFVANAVMIGALVTRPHLAPLAIREWLHPDAVAAEKAEIQREMAARDERRAQADAERVARERSTLWSRLHDDDLPTLVKHLRDAGFPHRVIRSMVEAEVNRRSLPRLRAIMGQSEDTPFWKAQSMHGLNQLTAWNQLTRDRSRQVREALGPEFLATENAESGAQKQQFGSLSPVKAQAVQQITDDYADMMNQVQTAAGEIMLPEDREKLAYLARERSADLAAILTPEELEQYEIRTSVVTARMRNVMTAMDATEEEFRLLYRIHEPYKNVLFGRTSTAVLSSMQDEAWAKIDAAAKAALGEKRFSEFLRASDDEYQRLSRIAQREKIPLERALDAYAVRDRSLKESMRIFNDSTLSAEQKRSALQSLAHATRTQLLNTLGIGAGNAYTKSATWLNAIQDGMGVTADPRGRVTMRGLPIMAPPPEKPNS